MNLINHKTELTFEDAVIVVRAVARDRDATLNGMLIGDRADMWAMDRWIVDRLLGLGPIGSVLIDLEAYES